MLRRLLILAAAALLSACPATGEEDLRKGNVLFTNGDFDLAEKHYRKALETAPDSARAMDGLGNIAFERGRMADAADWYRKAIAAEPDAISTYHRLAIALSESGRQDAAKEVLLQSIERADDDVFAYFSLGGIYARTGEVEKAEKMFAKAIALEERHDAARYALAKLLMDDGRTEEAERQLTRLTQNGAKTLAAYGHARIAAKANQPEQAAKYLDSVLEDGVDRPNKILEDEAFRKLWSHPAMKPVHEKLRAVGTSTRAR